MQKVLDVRHLDQVLPFLYGCFPSQPCSQKCVVEGADTEYEATYGMHSDGISLEFGFVNGCEYSTNVGPRILLM